MSSATTAGPPPNRFNGASGGGPVGGYGGINGSRAVADDGTRSANRVFPHIDDLLSVRPDVSPYAPIRRLLVEAETLAKQAESHLDFRRPDIALEEYIKAYIIAVDIVPRHKEYPDLKSDRGDLHRLYGGVQKRIISQHTRFEDVKRIIKENNSRSGVKPITSNLTSGITHAEGEQREILSVPPTPKQIPNNSGVGFVQILDSNNDISAPENGVSMPPFLSGSKENMLPVRKQPPPVQPKPDSLLGHSIKQSENISSKKEEGLPGEDIATRFARLRATESSAITPTQDPRIRTRPIVFKNPSSSSASLSSDHNSFSQKPPDRPSGPREMPEAPSDPPRLHKLSMGVQIPTMPRAPDAIYSPARGSGISEDLDLPHSSTMRNNFGSRRTNSIASINGLVRTPTSIEDRGDYFPPNQFPSKSQHGRTLLRPSSPVLPKSTTVSADELMAYLRRGSHDLRLLLVDIRAREQFDAGHIMSHSIICVEPISLKQAMSAEELGQSMILSPQAEQDLFEKRDEFDLVVCYDQSSYSSEARTHGQKSVALEHFANAVYDYGYDKATKRIPIFLIGGLEAWVDLMGVNALATSSTASYLPKPSVGLNTTSHRGIRDTQRVRRRTYESRPLTKEEENKWNETLKDEQVPTPSSLGDASGDGWSYSKSTGDFLRRFPEPSAIQESMIVPKKITPQQARDTTHRDRHHEELAAVMLRTPIPPRPVISRPSYSGVSERSSSVSGPSVRSNDADSTATVDPSFPTISEVVTVSGRTGLYNFGNTCYMNSVIQALNATRPFATYLVEGKFEETKPPIKAAETTAPPQLMLRNLANLMRHLWSGQYSYITPKTFRNYLRAIHCGDNTPRNTLGGDDQQDAADLLEYLLQILDDELNIKRDKSPAPMLQPAQIRQLEAQPLLEASIFNWNRHLMNNDSFITSTFGGQLASIITCGLCNHVVRSFDPWLSFQLAIRSSGVQTLRNALDEYMKLEDLGDYKCDSCHRNGSCKRKIQISRCPDILIIQLKRAQGTSIKTQTVVNFPLDGLDMAPYFIDVPVGSSQNGRRVTPPFKYTCYAVIQHSGSSVTSGHYWSLVRDRRDAQKWWKLEDRQPVIEIPSTRTQVRESYILFYSRVL